MKPEEIEAASMISNFAYRDTFEEELKKVLASGRIEKSTWISIGWTDRS